MKKIAAIILALLMVVSLFACGNGNEEGKSVPDSDSTADNADGGDKNDTPQAIGEDGGYLDDDVDHFARETYEFAYMYTAPSSLSAMMLEAFQTLGEVYNYTMIDSTGNSNPDQFISNMRTLANNGIDGFILDADPSVNSRIFEVADELGVPYIALFNGYRDDSGSSLVPTVMLDGYTSGYSSVKWLCDHYKDYFGDIDTSRIGMMSLTYSTAPDLQSRSDGAIDAFKEAFPDNENLISELDTVSGTLDETTAFNLASTEFTMRTGVDVDYWIVGNVVEMLSVGVARAAELLEIDDNVIITDVGSDMLSAEWNSGYEGCWVSCLAISNYLYTGPAVCGLIALVDGRCTPESLWQEIKEDTDKCAVWKTDSEMVTKDTYKDYFNSIADEFGVERPY